MIPQHGENPDRDEFYRYIKELRRYNLLYINDIPELKEGMKGLQSKIRSLIDKVGDIPELKKGIDELRKDYHSLQGKIRSLIDKVGDIPELKEGMKGIEKELGLIREVLEAGGGGGGEPPKDPPQYLFDLLKQETEQLWQRSIMLLTIFAGIFTAYGQIILPIFKEVTTIHTLTAQHHFFAALVALIGVIFAFLWIIIGKGAHYWYLKYYSVLENEYNKNHDPKEISYFNLPPIGVKDCLLSTHPGRFSLSRSQIAIGLILLFIWSAVFFSHVFLFFYTSGLDVVGDLFHLQSYMKKQNIGFMLLISFFSISITFIARLIESLLHEGKGDYPLEIDKKINKISAELKALGEQDAKNKIKELVENQPNIKNYFEDEEKLNKLVEYLYNKYCKK